MRTKLWTVILTLLLLVQLFPISFAQDNNRWSLPDGAKARLGKGKIIDNKLSPDGNWLAIASTIGVSLYDTNTGEETGLLTKDTDLVGLLAISQDGSKLAYTSGEKKCYIWNVENSKLLITFNTNETSYKSIFFLSDGKTLVTRNWQNTFSYWDFSTGELLDMFSPKASEIKIKGRIWHRAVDGVVTNNNSLIYAIGNHDGTISIQNGKTNQHIRTLVPKTNNDLFYNVGKKKLVRGKVEIVQFHPDVKVKLVEKPHLLNIRDDGTPFPIQYKMDQMRFSPEQLSKDPIKWVTNLKFSPDGKFLVSKCSYKTPRWDGTSGTGGPTELWDIETGNQLAALPWWTDVEFSSDSKTLAIISDRGFDKGKCHIWDLVDRHQIAEFEAISNVKYSGDGKKLFVRKSGSYDRTGKVKEKGSYTIWDTVSQSEVASHIPSEGEMQVPAQHQMISHNGKVLVSVTVNGSVYVWDTSKDTQSREFKTGYIREFTALAFTPDGKILASGGTGNIHLWDTDSLAKRDNNIKRKEGIDGIAFDNNNILTAVNPSSTVQYDVTTGQQIAANSNPIHLGSTGGSSVGFDDGTSIVYSGLVYSQKYRTLATNDKKENRIEIWNTETRKKIGVLTGKAPHLARGAMALTPKGDILATSDVFGQKYEVLLWDTDTDERIAALDLSKNFIDNLISRFTQPNITALAFDHDGKMLAIGTENEEIQLWHVATEKRQRILKTPQEHAICKLAFSPDGSILASGDTWGEINLWETTTGRHITTYKGHKMNINVLVFAQNNKLLGSTGLYDGTIMLWDVPTK